MKANHQCHPHSIDKELCLAQGQGRGCTRDTTKLSMKNNYAVLTVAPLDVDVDAHLDPGHGLLLHRGEGG